MDTNVRQRRSDSIGNYLEPVALQAGAVGTRQQSRPSLWKRSRRIDVLFDTERTINGLSAEERVRVRLRRKRSAPYLSTLEAWLSDERTCLSRSAFVAEPNDCMLKR